MSTSEKTSAASLLKRAAFCLLLVILYGVFGTLLNAGSQAQDKRAAKRSPVVTELPAEPSSRR